MTTMRAVTFRSFGGPEVLEIVQVPRPEPLPTEVLVEVRAAGVNAVDWKTRAGAGIPGVLGSPPFRIGWDVSGVVVATGLGVTRFAVGDEVYGMPWFPRPAGAYAEYVTAPARQFARKPPSLSHLEAGALPLAGLTAWQLVVDTVRLKSGQRILVHGAAGGVGHLAVQVAKALDATVFATARGDQSKFLRGLGVDQVIDYTTEPFDEMVSDLDAVLDFPGVYAERSLRVLKPGGILVSVPPSPALREISEQAARAGRRGTGFLVEPDQVGLEELAALVAEGHLQVRVSRVFELDAVAEAHRFGEQGGSNGKLVLRVSS
jgi:NADPH:quinone reductase-like Zn-dependent oxidoreductase